MTTLLDRYIEAARSLPKAGSHSGRSLDCGVGRESCPYQSCNRSGAGIHPLSNYVQTSDIRRARHFARVLRSGTIGINGTGNMHVAASFGGVGISGFGRKGGKERMLEFVSTKTVLIG